MNNKKTSYKLLSLDLDGTLLSGVMHKAKKPDCLALQEFMDCGGIPLINTGRAPWAVVKAVRQINKYGPNRIKLISCWNGAYIRDFSTGQTYERHISHEYCSKILNIVKEFSGAKVWFYTTRGAAKKRVECYPNNKLLKFVYTRSNLCKIKDENDLTSSKIVIFSSNRLEVAKVNHELMKQNLQQMVTINHTSPRMIEIMPGGVNKGYAINLIANKYKISKNEIVAMGDSFNDLSAFTNSALSIGINPKDPNLLIHCDEIVDKKAQGVKEAIHKYLLKSNVQSSKYKLIFSDLDGTLIDPKTKLFTSETKIALQQCTNHLIPIAIASGRGIYDGVNIVKKLELNPKTNVYVIGNNGATIYDMYTNNYVSQTPIDDLRARQVFKWLVKETRKLHGKLGFIIHQHSNDLLFYNPEYWKPINFKKTGFENRYDPWVLRKPVYITKYPDDTICYKYVVKFPTHEAALKGNDYLRKHFKDLEICLSSPVNVEINKKGVNKGYAVKKLTDILKLKLNNVIVLGDGQNDIPALKLCPNSYSPVTAPAFVKKEAKHIIRNVTADNFAATVIYREVLKKKKQGK